jgi:diguanylate cyclase (GGDEF)-like protein/PAS domain S-box-containing protein
MLLTDTHEIIKPFIETIGAVVVLFEKTDTDVRVISANSRVMPFCHLPAESLVDKSIHQTLPRFMARELYSLVEKCVSAKTSSENELVTDFAGEICWWRCVFTPIIFDGKHSSRVMMTAVDITEKYLLKKELEIIHERISALVDASYDGIITVDEQQHVMLMNRAAREILGYDEHDSLDDVHLRHIIPERFHQKHDQYIEAFKQSPVRSRPMQQRAAVTARRKDGGEVPVEISIAKIRVDNRLELTAVIRDLSEQMRLITELQKAASHDELTGIYNRRQLSRELQRELKRVQRFGGHFSVALLDLDHFKAINDQHGHQVGDAVLRHFAEAVRSELREVDIVGRWGGEEFLLICPETGGEEAMAILERIRQRLREHPYVHGDTVVPVQFSAGLAVADASTEGEDPLIKTVDDALYQAKKSGRNRTVLHV